MSMEIPATSLNRDRKTIELQNEEEIQRLRDAIKKGEVAPEELLKVRNRLTQLEADKESPL